MQDRQLLHKFLEENIYTGLKNLNDGFDANTIYYFSESDFEIVLDRVEKLGGSIYGIEPWLEGCYFGCKVYEETEYEANDPRWYRASFEKFKTKRPDLLYAASYSFDI